ncbi:MAG: TIGR00266 family protein [Alkalispirochaeta sp.]
MNVEILHRPANTAAKVTLNAQEECTSEGGAMIAMSGDMRVATSVNRQEGGLGRTILTGLSRQIAGEGYFLNTFTAGPSGGELYLGTHLPGDMAVVELSGATGLKVQSGAFVAHEQGVAMGIVWEGLKSMFSGERLIWLNMGGTGKVLINAFGMIYPVQVDGEYLVDTGNIAAFEDTLEYTVSKAGGSWLSSFLGGEGLVARFSGRGTVWCQTHADRVFGSRLTPHLKPRKEQ